MRIHQSDSLPRLVVGPNGRAPSLERSRIARVVPPLIAGGLLRLVAAFLAPLAPQWDGAIYVRGAEQLAAGHGYTTGILAAHVPTWTPTAFYPVGFPFVLAVVRILGGNRRTDLVVQAIIGVLTIAATHGLAKRLFGERVAVRAAYVLALAPGAILFSTTWLADPLVALGILVSLLVLTSARLSHPASVAGFGMAMGLTSYLRVTPLVIAPIVAFGVTHARRRRSPRGARVGASAIAAASAFAFALVVLAPWMARNARELGSPAVVSTNGGVNLLMGTVGEGGFGAIPEFIDCPRSLTEIELDRCRRDHAIERIARDPVAFVARGVNKVYQTFGHESAPAQHLASASRDIGRNGSRALALSLGVTRLAYLATFVAACLGACRIATSRHAPARAVLLGPILGLAVLHFAFIGGDRYHVAVLPMIAVLAALGSLAPRRAVREALRHEARDS